MHLPIISIVGSSDSGKTTLLEKILKELKNRGYRVATIKHNTHDFEIDQPGKDTWKHRQAGSDIVMICSPFKLAMIENTDKELSLDDLAGRAVGVDIILTEGYKKQNKPKIEVIRNNKPPICGKEDHLWALVGSKKDLQNISAVKLAEQGVICFQEDQTKDLVDRIENDVLGG